MAARCSTFFDFLRRPGDGDKEDANRRVIVPALGVDFVLALLAIATSLNATMYLLGLILNVAGSTVGLVYIFLRLPGDQVRSTSYFALPLICLGLLLCDASNASLFNMQVWPLVVLVMDVLVVINGPRSVQIALLSMTVVFLTVDAAENGSRFGWYDVGQWNQGSVKRCQCENPPCAMSVFGSTTAWCCAVCVFLLDFYITRGFAVELRSQLDLVATTVRVSERVTEMLAAYRTDDARRVVSEEGSALPEALRTSYERLLKNLDSYRAFLPDSLLLVARMQQEQQQQAEGHPDNQRQRLSAASMCIRSAPGLGEEDPEVALCFTDIQSSTEIWEAHPQGMYEGLNIHNRVMRDCYSVCGGYEVKTIGDSFMVAFDEAAEALRFGLEAQLGLLRQHWPEDLLTHHLCQRIAGPGGEPLWGGLRVRIGVQYGPVRVETNPVTGRCDYFGHTVNTAARLEAVLKKGGMVACTNTVIEMLGEAGLRDLGSPVVHDVGAREMRGIREQIPVMALVPQVLMLRLEVLKEPPNAHVVDAGVVNWREGSRIHTAESLHSSGGTASRRSSLHSGSAGSSVGQPSRPRHTQSSVFRQILQLQQSVATCAAVRMRLHEAEPVGERIPAFVAAAALAADKTQGVVDCVTSASVMVTWNSSVPCTDHAASCRHFLAAPFRAPCNLGAMTGGVLHGSLSAGRRSFTAVVGACVQLASALVEEAELCDDLVLATGSVATQAAAAGEAYGAQMWYPIGGVSFVVWSVEPTAAAKWAQWELDDDAGGAQGAERWGQRVSALFRQACAGSPEEQQEILAELEQLGDCTEAARLAGRIRDGTVRCRKVPALWEPAPRSGGSMYFSGFRPSSPSSNPGDTARHWRD